MQLLIKWSSFIDTNYNNNDNDTRKNKKRLGKLDEKVSTVQQSSMQNLYTTPTNRQLRWITTVNRTLKQRLMVLMTTLVVFCSANKPITSYHRHHRRRRRRRRRHQNKNYHLTTLLPR